MKFLPALHTRLRDFGLGALLSVFFALPFTAAAQAEPGRALNFDGTNDIVTVPANSAFEFVDGTVELWARPTYSPRGDNPQLVSNRSSSGTSTRWSYHMAGNYSGLLIWNGSVAQQVNYTFTAGTWYHIAFVESGATTTFYVNGAAIGSVSATSSSVTGLPVNIGGASGGERFQGDIDEVRIWNVARTQAQISANRFAELIGSETGLVAYYKFNQGTAGDDNTGVTTATDSAGGDNNGTLTNFALTGATSNWIAPGAFVPSGTGNILGNGVTIVNGDTTPSLADHTHFGLVPNGASMARTFTIQNVHAAEDLTVYDIAVSGVGASDYVVSGITFPAIIPAGGAATFVVTLNSTSNAPRDATVSLACSDVGYLFQVSGNGLGEANLQGNGVTIVAGDHTPSASDDTYFGTVPNGSSAARTFTIQNSHASEDLTLHSISITGLTPADFTLSGITLPVTLAPGGSTTFTVTLTSSSNRGRGAVVTINNSDSDEFAYDFAVAANAVSGTKMVGPTGFYSSIGEAIADMQAGTVSGPVLLELQPTYLSTVETFPLVFSNLGTTVTNTLTILPASGATALSISSADTTAATVDLNGAQFVTIDGRPGGVGSNVGSGVGTASQLTVANTSTSGVTVRFINEASGNALRYLTLQGVNTSSSSGTVVFSTTTGANGNDNNTLDHCDIGDGASTPANALYSLGSTGTTAQNNSGNTVSNCNVFNFYAATAIDSAGVRLDDGNTDWTVSGNSFYQTATRTAVAGFVRAIYVNDTAGNNFAIANNFIGGTAANAGGTAWTVTRVGQPNYRFVGIHLRAAATTPSSVQGNTVTKFTWTGIATTTAPGAWAGIYLEAGSANVGTTAGNTIGSGSGTSSVSSTTLGATTYGIVSASANTVTIANNTVGSIDTIHGSSTASSLFAIQVTAGTNVISNNLVGSTTTANSLNATSAASSAVQICNGITSSSSSGAVITNNIVANLNNNATQGGTSSTAASGSRGIVVSAGANTISGNTIRNLTAKSAHNSMSGAGPSVGGIVQTSTAAGQTISGNVIHSLANKVATGTSPITVTGIHYVGPASGTNTIARNLIHSLSTTSPTTTASLNGIRLQGGTFTAQNNMVRVGLDATGASAAPVSIVRGIFDEGANAGRNFYHNSVYVGGTQTSGAANTFAFTSTGATNARDFRNNIFVNARGNGGGTGKHYAVQYGGTTANPTGLTASNNVFLANSTGGHLGLYNGTDRDALADWQSATGQDAASVFADPLYVNPTGTVATVDLHLQATSPAGNVAAVLAAVTDDFDGQPRSATMPDIGADEFDPSNAFLRSLAISSGPLSPAFAPGTTTYTAASVANAVSSLIVTPLADEPQATVTVNGTAIPRGSAAEVPLNAGSNTITVVVTAQDGATKTYTIMATRRTVFGDWALANGASTDPMALGANGQKNLLNFAFGMDPKLGQRGALSVNGGVITPGTPTTLAATNPDMSQSFFAAFGRRKDYLAAGLTYTVQFTTDFLTWTDSADPPTVIADDGTLQAVVVPYPFTQADQPFQFFRVIVGANEPSAAMKANGNNRKR